MTSPSRCAAQNNLRIFVDGRQVGWRRGGGRGAQAGGGAGLPLHRPPSRRGPQVYGGTGVVNTDGIEALEGADHEGGRSRVGRGAAQHTWGKGGREALFWGAIAGREARRDPAQMRSAALARLAAELHDLLPGAAPPSSAAATAAAEGTEAGGTVSHTEEVGRRAALHHVGAWYRDSMCCV